MNIRKPEDLTLDEIKEQMALYQRLYYYRTKDSPEHQASRKEAKRKYYLKKKAEQEEQKRLEEPNKEEPPQGREYMRKYNKDVNEAMLIV